MILFLFIEKIITIIQRYYLNKAHFCAFFKTKKAISSQEDKMAF